MSNDNRKLLKALLRCYKGVVAALETILMEDDEDGQQQPNLGKMKGIYEPGRQQHARR